MKCPVKTLDNGAAGEIDLADAVFGAEVRKDLLARMVNWQLAKRRSGNHKAKTRGEVQGSTRKLYKQKGTGQARVSSSRMPQRRGGGRVHGPVVRSHEHDLPKSVRLAALRSALSAKAKDGKLLVLDSAKAADAKTKGLAVKLKGLGLTSAVIIDGPAVDQGFLRAVRNIAQIDVLPSQGANVYDILRRDTLVLTREAVAQLEARLK